MMTLSFWNDGTQQAVSPLLDDLLLTVNISGEYTSEYRELTRSQRALQGELWYDALTQLADEDFFSSSMFSALTDGTTRCCIRWRSWTKILSFDGDLILTQLNAYAKLPGGV